MADERWGIIGNPMNGRAEGFDVSAQFTSHAKAVAYEAASRLPAIEIKQVDVAHYAGFSDHPWHFFYREDSALRWMNQVPMEPDHWYPGRFVRLNYFISELPIDPELAGAAEASHAEP